MAGFRSIRDRSKSILMKRTITPSLSYAGFWRRCAANLLDTALIYLVTLPPLYYFYGTDLWTDQRVIKGQADFLIGWVLPTAATLWFWGRLQATPGKRLFGARIVDAKTLGPLSQRQNLIRYLGCILSIIPLGAGFLWVAVDSRKQGLHDKLAGSLVIREPPP